MDPGLEYSYDQNTQKFSVEATTGIAAWVWLDYPAGMVAHFEDNGFWVTPGVKRVIGFEVQGGNATTDGAWLRSVTAESLWNMTLP